MTTDLHDLSDAILTCDLAIAQAHQDVLNCSRAAESLRTRLLLAAYRAEPSPLTGKNERIREMQEAELLEASEEYQEVVAGEDAARFDLRVAQLRRDEAHRTWQAEIAEWRVRLTEH